MACICESFTENNLLAIFGIIFAVGIWNLYTNFCVYSYWKRLGVRQMKTFFPFGNFGSSFIQTTHIGLYMQNVYKNSKEPFIGLYAGFKPLLLVNDPALVHCIFTKDFHNFMDRGFYIDEKREPLSAHLFSMEGDKWKNLRSKLTPLFTPGKLRAMFPTFIECTGPLIKFMENIVDLAKPIDIREILAGYTTNIVSSVAFGIDIDCISNPNHAFRIYGRKFFDPTLGNSIRALISFAFPSLMSIFDIRFIHKDIENFIFSMVKQSLAYRENNNVTRKDFFQLMVQLRNTGNVQLDDEWETIINEDEMKKTLTIEEVAAQAFLFLIAGFETSSSTMSYCLYELARQPKYQRKVQQEIDDTLLKYNGQITYDAINELHFLECCVKETLRIHPPLLMLNRKCTMDWKIPNTDIIIKKGIHIVIPALALQMDEKYFPNPEQFQPDRYSRRHFSEFIDKPYMPFGQGPRICIGSRLGKLQSKVGLVSLLKNYNFNLAGNNLERPVINPRSFVMAPLGGLTLKASRR